MTSVLSLVNSGCTSNLSDKESHYRLSSRFFYPVGINGHPSTIEVLDKLKPAYIEWTYNYSVEALNAYKNRGIKYSIAMNPQIPDSLGYTTGKLSIKKRNGDYYVAPWMKDWKISNPFWGCVNNPGFYSLFLNRGLQIAATGAYAIIVDDSLFNARLNNDGEIGCFCNYCISGFYDSLLSNGSVNNKYFNSLSINYLQNNELLFSNDSLSQDYITFQRNSVIKFLKTWMIEMRVEYPEILFYTNNFGGEWNDIYINFDGGIAELNENYINESALDKLYKTADSLDKFQIFTLASDNYTLQKELMQYNAKNDKVTLLPWDIYISGSERYYMNLDSLKNLQEIFFLKYNYR